MYVLYLEIFVGEKTEQNKVTYNFTPKHNTANMSFHLWLGQALKYFENKLLFIWNALYWLIKG